MGATMDNEEYRELLQKLEVESQQAYDKAVFALSGGALGLSFAFIKNVVPLAEAASKHLLVFAWFTWGLSITSVLVSHFFSVLALRAQIDAVDANKDLKRPKIYDFVTSLCNAAGGLLFIIGVLLLAHFVNVNFEAKNEPRQQITTQTHQTERSATSGGDTSSSPTSKTSSTKENVAPEAPHHDKTTKESTSKKRSAGATSTHTASATT